jgi:hypothetical protein
MQNISQKKLIFFIFPTTKKKSIKNADIQENDIGNIQTVPRSKVLFFFFQI